MDQDTAILLVEDEPVLRDVVCSYLEAKGYHVFPAGSGAQALELFGREDISLVLLDLMLPDLAGEEVCAALRRRSGVPILMLTAKTAEEDLLHGLRIGADDYLTKPFSLKELCARMEAVLRRAGSPHLPPATRYCWNGGDLEVDFSCRTVKKQGRAVSLTPLEWKLLAVFLKYPQKVFTRDDLLAAAFDAAFDGYDRVIDTHIKNLRKKLEDDPRRPVYIRTVHGVGYQFRGDAL